MSQLYHEAVKILYDENAFLVGYSRFETELPGVLYRKDDPRDADATSRQLRNGRSVDMVNHTGLIYPSVFYRLRKVEFHVDVLDMNHPINAYNYLLGVQFHSVLAVLYNTISQSSSEEMSAVRATNRDWTIVIHSLGEVGHGDMKKMLKPILWGDITKGVRQGDLQMKLRGSFPKGWESIFRELVGPGLSVKEMDLAEEISDDDSTTW